MNRVKVKSRLIDSELKTESTETRKMYWSAVTKYLYYLLLPTPEKRWNGIEWNTFVIPHLGILTIAVVKSTAKRIKMMIILISEMQPDGGFYCGWMSQSRVNNSKTNNRLIHQGRWLLFFPNNGSIFLFGIIDPPGDEWPLGISEWRQSGTIRAGQRSRLGPPGTRQKQSIHTHLRDSYWRKRIDGQRVYK